MSYDPLNEIFIYNIRWLTGEKKFSDYIKENVEKDLFNLKSKFLDNFEFFANSEEIKNFKQRVPSYARGALIDNTKAIELKEELRKKLTRIEQDITNDVLEVSKYCVINDLKRYKTCNNSRISRPFITFITLKKNAEKLRYLENQTVKYEYLTLDYSEIKNSSQNDKRLTKPTMYSYNKISSKFNNKLLISEKDDNGDYYYFIPLEVSSKDRKLESKINDINKNYENDKKQVEQDLGKINKDIKDKKKELDNNPSNKKLQGELKKLKEEEENKIQEYQKILSKKVSTLSVDKDELEERTLNSDYITNSYILENNYYYKKLLERFKFRVEKKLDLKIDLDDWSFCIMYSPLWCDKGTSLNKYTQLTKLIKSLGATKEEDNTKIEFSNKIDKELLVKELGKFYNMEVDSYNIDNNMLFYLKSVFQEPEIQTMEYYKEIGELNDFDIVLKAFKNFPEGGYWIKRIVKEKGIFYEKTEGPYTLELAKKRVAILKNILSFDDTESAKYYSFKDLVCNYDIYKDAKDSKINKYVKSENRYVPYQGTRLFCLLVGYEDIVFFDKQNLTEKFRKFNNFAINNGISYITSLNYLIYYKPKSESSVRKATEVREIIRNKKNYKAEELLWLFDTISGKESKRGYPPIVLPFNFLSEFQNNGKITYEGLKSLYNYVKNNECSDERLMISFKNFENAIGDMYLNKYRNSNFEIKSELSLGVIMNEYDDKVKKFKISKEYDEKYKISMTRTRKTLKDIELISIKNIDDCTGYLNIKFRNLKDKTWDISKLNLISNDMFFNNEFRLTALILFLAKCFGVRTVIVDNSLQNSECDNDILYHYYHIYYIGYGNFDIFEELGFKVENYLEYQNIINQIKFMTIGEFLTKYKLKGNVNKLIYNLTLERFCKDYINTNKCFTKNNNYIIQEISKKVESLINLNIFIDLDTLSTDSLEKIIST